MRYTQPIDVVAVMAGCLCVYINNIREASASRTVTSNDLLFGKHLLLRMGKKNYVVVTAMA